MTRFILMGGYLPDSKVVGREFVEEFVRDLGPTPKILICLFARLDTNWAEIFESESKSFAAYAPDKKLKLALACADTFLEQVRWADAIYFRGGSSEGLVKALQNYASWADYIDGKTIAGSSAGADALSKYYFGLDSLQVREGLGLLPIKVIPHFKSNYHGWEFDWDGALKELKAYKEPLDVFALGEGEFRVLNV